MKETVNAENKEVQKSDCFVAYFMGANNHPAEEVIPLKFKDSYSAVFGNKIPTKEQYENWKQTTGAEAVESPDVKVVGSKEDREGFKIIQPLKKELYDYLNDRPMVEVEHIIWSMFENPEIGDDPYYTAEGIKMLTTYLQKHCPRKDAKAFIERLANGGLERYVIKMENKKDVPENPDNPQA